MFTGQWNRLAGAWASENGPRILLPGKHDRPVLLIRIFETVIRANDMTRGGADHQAGRIEFDFAELTRTENL